MIKLAICDDELIQLNTTRAMLEMVLSQHSEYAVKISCFTSPSEFFQAYQNQGGFDILLLDIYMPMLSGVELAKKIRALEDDCQIIFITTSTAHAIEAFSLHAAHYLVKPYSVLQLSDAIGKAITAVNRNQKAHVTLKISGGVQKVSYNEILYAETERHNQHLHLSGGKCLRVRIKSSELYELLSGDHRFYKCGSTYIINLELVKELTVKDIVFENEESIPMLRRHYKALLNEYTEYSLRL